MARFFHSLWIRGGFLFIFSSLGMSGPQRGWPCLAPTGLPSEDQWGFLFFIEAGDPPEGWGVQRTIANKEFRTAEVFEKNKAMFFTSIFCGFLFCGSVVHILKDLITYSQMLNADRRDLILTSWW